MAVEWYERLHSHRMVDDIRLPNLSLESLSNAPGKFPREMISTVCPIQRETTACILCKAMDLALFCTLNGCVT